MKNGFKMRNDNAIASIIGVVILLAVGVFIIFLMNGTKTEATVKVNENIITITGQYGTNINISNITKISLEESIPPIGTKVNGAGLGDIKKGDYMVEGMGKCRLFLHAPQGPFIVIDTVDGYVIINFNNQDRTEDVFLDLQNHLYD